MRKAKTKTATRRRSRPARTKTTRKARSRATEIYGVPEHEYRAATKTIIDNVEAARFPPSRKTAQRGCRTSRGFFMAPQR